MRVHLDTNAYSAFLAAREGAVFIVERAPTLALSPIVLGELKAGFALGRRNNENLRLLDRFLSSARVVVPPIDDRVTDEYARIYKELRAAGTPLPTNDLWVAACVSRDTDVLFSYDTHFERIAGLPVVRTKEEFLATLA